GFVECVEECAPNGRDTSKGPQHFGVGPRGFAGRTHVPHCCDIINTAGRDVYDADDANGKVRFHLSLDAFEQLVHAIEVLTPRLIRTRIAAKCFEYLHDPLREVAIDVRVHPGQRELEAGYAAISPGT